MEVLAIGLLGLAGKFISDRFNNNKNDDYIESDEEEYEIPVTRNGFDQKKRVMEAMNSVVKEKKVLSNDPNNKNIIPSLYNKRVYTMDTENKYISPITGPKYANTIGDSYLDKYSDDTNLMEGPINKLTTLDEQFSSQPIINHKPVPENVGKLTLPDNWTPYNKSDDDMTYKIFNKDELIHNNMQPFFKDRGLLITQDNSRNMEQTLDIYTGSSRFYFAKKEQPNIIENFEEGFSTASQPVMMTSYTRGTPVQTDLLQDRYFSGKEKRNDKPFEDVKVTPGLNLGANEDGKVGFQDPYQPPTKTINELRRWDNPQISYTQPLTKGSSGQEKGAVIGDVVNKKPATYGTLGQDYTIMPTSSNVTGPTDKGNFNFDKSHRGEEEIIEQGGAGPGNFEAGISIDNFGKVKNPFKIQLAPLDTAIGTQTERPNNDIGSYNNSVTQRSTANSQYSAGLSGSSAGDVSLYQPTTTQRLNQNANFTGSMGNSSGGGIEMSLYQPTITQRLNQNANFTGSMGNSSGGGGGMSLYQSTTTQRLNQNANFTGSMGGSNTGEMSLYQNTPTQRFNQTDSFTGGMGNSSGGSIQMSLYQPMTTQRLNQNANFTGSMGGSNTGEMSLFQNTPTQRFNQNANFTGSMGGSNTGEMSLYQNTPTQRFNQNANFTGSMGNNSGGTGEVSLFQPTATFRAVTNDNYTGVVGGGNNTGEVSNYTATPTNRIISNNLMGLPVSAIGGNGYTSTVTNPMATMRVNSTPMVGVMGMENMGGYISETVTPMTTLRQNMNTSGMGGVGSFNGVGQYSSDAAERNMFIRDTKENLLVRNSPTPVNAFQPPDPKQYDSMTLKNFPSTMLSSTGFLPTTDYLPFIQKQKDIQIPSTYPAFNPQDMIYNNPYINNIIYKADPNFVFTPNLDNNFNQNSQDQIKNNITNPSLDPNIANNNF